MEIKDQLRCWQGQFAGWGLSMQRVNAAWVIETVEAIDGIDRVTVDARFGDVIGYLYTAHHQLDALFTQSIYNHFLNTCRGNAGALSSELSKYLQLPIDYERRFAFIEHWALSNAKQKFKTVFLAELSVLPVFLITRRDNFDVNLLVNDGLGLFPPTLKTKVPEATADALEAGRALAFELSTACGFHMFRVLEAVTRRYWDQVSHGADRPKLQTLGSFAKEMVDKNLGDEKVAEAIKQLTRLHRNPIMHPEVILSSEEALGIVGMARSAVAPMLQVLPDAPITTSTPVFVVGEN